MASIILVPGAVSFSHIFSDHGHEICLDYADEHFHDHSVDCELYKFHKNNALEISLLTFEAISEETQKKKTPNHYSFLSDYHRLPFDLRGPPVV